jgi:hypothetical protein
MVQMRTVSLLVGNSTPEHIIVPTFFLSENCGAKNHKFYFITANNILTCQNYILS